MLPSMLAVQLYLHTCLQTFPPKDAVEAIKQLVRLDKDWIPEGDGYSLYIRPQVIATEVGSAKNPAPIAVSNTFHLSPILVSIVPVMPSGM